MYIWTCAVITLWQAVTCAATTPAQILVFRALAGFFGSTPFANGAGTVTDVLSPAERGVGVAVFAASPFLGPAIGPIVGGYLGMATNWKWVEGVLALFCAAITAVFLLFVPETYAPTILRKRAKTLTQATGRQYAYHGDVEKPFDIPQHFKVALVRPWLLLLEPIVFLLSLYIAIIYGTLYLNFAAYPIVFTTIRGWNMGQTGLAFIGIAVGVLLAVAVTIRIVKKKAAQIQDGMPEPEERLPPAVIGGVAAVIGLAGFAATDAPSVHWIASIIFGVPFGFGLVIVFLSVASYLIDAYTIYSASVIASNTILRSLLGAAFPMFTRQMYDRLGIHWAAALPGFLTLVCIPFPILFIKYGKRIRARGKYVAEADRAMRELIARREGEHKTENIEEMDTLAGTTRSKASTAPSHLTAVFPDSRGASTDGHSYPPSLIDKPVQHANNGDLVRKY